MMVYAINKPNAEHLKKVMEEMKILGAPTVRAFNSGDAYYAIEGSHRLAAAHLLGITPNIVEVEEDEVINNHDLEDLDDSVTVQAILEYADWSVVAYDFE